jgi:hypothetical protein
VVGGGRTASRGSMAGGGASGAMLLWAWAGVRKETAQAWKMQQFMMPWSALVRVQRATMERGLGRGGREPRCGRCGRRAMRGHSRRTRTLWQGLG